MGQPPARARHTAVWPRHPTARLLPRGPAAKVGEDERVMVLALVVVAVLLAWPVPRLLPRLHKLRHVPGPALVLWQSVSLAAVLAGLAAAPLGAFGLVRTGSALPSPALHPLPLLVGLVVTGLLLVRLLLQGHRIGTALRRSRREHLDLVDLLGLPSGGIASPSAAVRVLAHPTPTAYCVPGRQARVVLTDSTMARLPGSELGAVLAHERAHLRYRHDLVLEFFTVLHTAVPAALRSPTGLAEVRLLIEILADRVALRTYDAVSLGRALVALAGGEHPSATLGAGRSALTRLELLSDRHPRPLLTALVLSAAAGALLLPALLVVLALL